jgi:hypothetical protein
MAQSHPTRRQQRCCDWILGLKKPPIISCAASALRQRWSCPPSHKRLPGCGAAVALFDGAAEPQARAPSSRTSESAVRAMARARSPPRRVKLGPRPSCFGSGSLAGGQSEPHDSENRLRCNFTGCRLQLRHRRPAPPRPQQPAGSVRAVVLDSWRLASILWSVGQLPGKECGIRP